MRFIVVDDEPACNMISKFTIRRLDKEAQVEVFTNPVDALLYIKTLYLEDNECEPSFVLLDINMPYMNGWEFLKETESYGPEVHKYLTIHIVSSSVDANDEAKAKGCALVKGFISKPIKLENLKEIVKDSN
ncbi:MAG TPA: response regulator [Pedobacter sp.]|jgi:CheY-like chemotaxis protein